MEKLKAAVFDLDGTLLDSMYVWDKVDIEFLHKRGLTLPDFYQKECSVRSFYETAVYTKELFDLSETPEQLMEEWSNLARIEYSEKVPLMAGATEALDKAERLGLTLAVCSSNSTELFIPTLKRLGILDRFSLLVSASDFGTGKHSPEVFYHTAKELGVSTAECVMIDDMAKALKAAKQSGMKTVGYYYGDKCQDMEEIKRYSDKVVYNLADIF